MKKLYSLSFFCFLSFSAFAQPHTFQCGFQEDPDMELPADIGKYQRGEKSLVKLQTVVHVIYHDLSEDMSDEFVKDRLNEINQHFRRQTPDTVDTPDAFKPVAADTEIEFELASVDPSGGPTTGITHTESPFQTIPLFHAMFDSTGGKDAWNTSKYVNIWLVGNYSFLDGPGFASPLSFHGTPRDGVVMGPLFLQFFDNLTHYLGHYLGLYHPFKYEDGLAGPNPSCSTSPGGPDGLEDTPNQLLSSQAGTCPDFPKTDICSPDSPGVMFMNYMDYSAPFCQNMFTHQQAARMHWVLDSIRFSLLEPTTPVGESGLHGGLDCHIYPNPVHEKVRIEFHSPVFSATTCQLFDGMGRPVFTGVLDGTAHAGTEINIGHLPKGIYFIKIKSGQMTRVDRIVKL